MTIREIKYINKQIHTLLHRIERLRACACNISPKVSQAPGGAHTDDKIGKYVAEIEESEEKLRKLRAYRDKELSRLSLDVDEENCIWLHLARGYSWRKIAMTVDDRPDTADSIRMRCLRYKW